MFIVSKVFSKATKSVKHTKQTSKNHCKTCNYIIQNKTGISQLHTHTTIIYSMIGKLSTFILLCNLNLKIKKNNSFQLKPIKNYQINNQIKPTYYNASKLYNRKTNTNKKNLENKKKQITKLTTIINTKNKIHLFLHNFSKCFASVFVIQTRNNLLAFAFLFHCFLLFHNKKKKKKNYINYTITDQIKT